MYELYVTGIFSTPSHYNFMQPMPINYDQNGQNQTKLKVKFNNVYVFPFKTMYKPNKFPIPEAEQTIARLPVRRSKKRAARQNEQEIAEKEIVLQNVIKKIRKNVRKNVQKNVQQNVQETVQQNVPPVIQPPIQSARSQRANLRATQRENCTAS